MHIILANRNFAFNCGSVAVFTVCCSLRKEPCAAINAQIIKTRRLEKIKHEGWKKSSKKAGKIKQEGWKRPSKKAGKTKQEGWKRLSKKAGKD